MVMNSTSCNTFNVIHGAFQYYFFLISFPTRQGYYSIMSHNNKVIKVLKTSKIELVFDLIDFKPIINSKYW